MSASRSRIHMIAANYARFATCTRVVYDDGRPGHQAIRADVLNIDTFGLLVQFEDRADTTRIEFSDADWMQHLQPVD